MESLAHYINHFQNAAKFTSFTDSDEYLFSQQGLDIEEYLLAKERQGISMVVMREKHFRHRYCVKNKRVTDIVDYYPAELETKEWFWNPKTLSITKEYLVGPSIHHGLTRRGKKVNIPFEELGYHHYNLEYSNMEFGVLNNYSNSTGFVTDDSLQKRYSKHVDGVCQQGCS